MITCLLEPPGYQMSDKREALPCYNKTCATSEDSNQTARSLIRFFADRICLLQPRGYPKRDKREQLPYWVDVQPDLSLCWSHRSYYRVCRALAYFKFKTELRRVCICQKVRFLTLRLVILVLYIIFFKQVYPIRNDMNELRYFLLNFQSFHFLYDTIFEL